MLNSLIDSWLRESCESIKMCQWCESKVYQVPGYGEGVTVDGLFFCFACEDAFHVAEVCDHCGTAAPRDSLNTGLQESTQCVYCQANCCQSCLDLFSCTMPCSTAICLGCSSNKILSEMNFQLMVSVENAPLEPLSSSDYAYRREARALFLSKYKPKSVELIVEGAYTKY